MTSMEPSQDDPHEVNNDQMTEPVVGGGGGGVMKIEKMGLDSWLLNISSVCRVRNWRQIRLFISSTFIDTHGER